MALRTIYIPGSIDEKLEKAAKKLGWSRSFLYRYALTKFLQELSILTEMVHAPENKGSELPSVETVGSTQLGSKG